MKNSDFLPKLFGLLIIFFVGDCESIELPYSLSRFFVRRDPLSYLSKTLSLIGFREQPYQWTEEYYEKMPIDHFSYLKPKTFRLRYLLNTEHFEKNGPIFFYTGNEGNIEGFALNTGFMWDIAREFGAAIVFAEHRFYGKTYPFGKDSYKTVENLGYLSSEQALADYAVLITYLKEERIEHARNSAVIAFGGSYGGMLAAWMRIKYPHLVDGAIAAKGRDFLNEQFHLDEKSLVNSPSDGDLLVASIQSVMETLVMVDYPYEADFLAKLPAWPVKEACKNFPTIKHGLKTEDFALASYKLLNIFYNSTGQTKTLCMFGSQCPNPFAQLGDPDGWPWQACTEMVMPMCSSGPPQSFFEKNCPYDESAMLDSCQSSFGKIGFTSNMFRPDWAIINYGSHYDSASNIVFSNGYLDPWSGGGWKLAPFTQGSLVSLIVEDGAHHYDLRSNHPNDTESVKRVRAIEKEHIRRWIQEAAIARKMKKRTRLTLITRK